MKISPLLFVLFLIACSPPKYTYHFDHYSGNSKVSESTKISPNDKKSSSEPIQDLAHRPAIISASTNSSIPTIFNTASHGLNYRDKKPSFKKDERKETKGIIREFKKTIKTNQVDGNPRKNWAAISGFSLSIFSVLAFFLGIGTTLVLWPAVVLGIPAIVFSIIGLKSERRRLAWFGLFIELGFVSLLLLLLILVLSTIVY